MKSLMQQALGADWDKLPAALQAHYRFGTTRCCAGPKRRR
jgi:hypothetical protein